jgi:DNA-binding CsgD family transcriptional regulator
MQEANLLRAKGWLEVARNDPLEARDWFARAADLAAEQGSVIQELAALHDQARAGVASPDLARARAVAEAIDSPLAPAQLAHIEAVAAGDGDALAAASRSLEACGAVLAAAEAAFAAADALRRDGSANASAQERRGAELAEQCDGAATPGLRRTVVTVALTRREEEVARLAASGMASRDIAATLALSVRTVDNHLARIYDKLAIPGRSGLAAALQGAGKSGQ